MAIKYVFKLYDLTGRCLGKRAIGIPPEEKAGRLRKHYIVIGGTGSCYDCGHQRGRTFERRDIARHELDHFLGYDCINKLFVQEVCRWCHVKRTQERLKRAKAGMPKYPT